MRRIRFAFAVATIAAAPLLASPEDARAAGPFLEPDAVALVTLTGETPTDQFGWAAERLGDIDGDGIEDFIVGAPSSAAGGFAAGRAYVYSGRDGALLNVLTGGPGERFGNAVAGIPDADGDGIADYAVGGPGSLGSTPPMPGRVTLYSGATHAVLQSWGGDGNSFFGADINSAGDVDGDGRGDVIVGAPRTNGIAGRVEVLSGRTGLRIWSTNGLAPGDAFGTGVSGLGDLDGDGAPEQGAGARNAGNSTGGLAYVLSGSTGSIVKTLHPAGTAFDFGWFFVHDADDVDRDGVRDIYVGDFADTWRGASSGRGYVYSGATGQRIRTMNAEFPGDGFGVGRGIGDIDGDGHADLIIAAWTSSSGAPGGGKAYVVSGRNGATLRTITGTVAGANLGVDALGIGDVNADGLPDFILTTFNNVYVVAGTPLPAK